MHYVRQYCCNACIRTPWPVKLFPASQKRRRHNTSHRADCTQTCKMQATPARKDPPYLSTYRERACLGRDITHVRAAHRACPDTRSMLGWGAIIHVRAASILPRTLAAKIPDPPANRKLTLERDSRRPAKIQPEAKCPPYQKSFTFGPQRRTREYRGGRSCMRRAAARPRLVPKQSRARRENAATHSRLPPR